jgi:hypothetical protein
LFGCPVSTVGRQGNPRLATATPEVPALTSHSDLVRKTKKPVGNGPAGLLEEVEMVKALKLLRRIVVKIGVKVKIIIIRR